MLSYFSQKEQKDRGFASPEILVDATWVAALLAGENPANNPSNDFVILECQWGLATPDSDYAHGHVPQAIYINSDDFETGPPAYFLKPTASLLSAIEQLGITSSTTIVVYSAWTLAAARCWWILRYVGVKDVRFFEGGYAAWVAAGGAVETTPNVPRKPRSFSTVGKETSACACWLASTTEIEAIVQATPADTIIVDVRSLAEYLGHTSGYRSLEVRGKIPGALWGKDACGDWGSPYLDTDGLLRTADEIRALWTPLGVTSDRQIIFYCGGGWRSSLAFLYAQLLGFQRVRNYSNGWFEWSAKHG
jgi:3-mercaptopyruvate sulfurtransferase SseA